MNLSTNLLPRIPGSKKRTERPQPERVEGIYLQESGLHFDPHGLQKASTSEQTQIPAADILAEMTCSPNDHSAAGRTAFIP